MAYLFFPYKLLYYACMYKFLFFGLVSFLALFTGFFFLRSSYFGGLTQDSVQSATKKTAQDVPVWERKRLDAAPLRVGLITDTHVDSVRPPSRILEERTIPVKYTRPVANFVAQMEMFNPSFVVHLGDVIEGTGVDLDVGKFELQKTREGFSSLTVPMYWVIGNHDLRSVARKHFHQELGIDYSNHYFDEGAYRFVIVDTNYRTDGVPNHPHSGDPVSGFVPRETLHWLENVLATDRHVYVFLHHSVVPRELTNKKQIGNDEEVRHLFARYNVAAVFSGHIEKRFQGDFDGVRYYTLPGILKNPLYPGAFYALDLLGKSSDLTMFYTGMNETIVQEPFYVDGKMIDQILQEKNAQEVRELESEDSLEK